MILSFKGIKPKLGKDVFIAQNAVVTADVEIGDQSSVWYGCVIRGDVNTVRIGKQTNIQDGTIVHVTRQKYPTVIGDRVTIGHGCILHGCVIEDDSFIGMGATVMDGVVIESGAMVAAGALVTPGKRVKKGELWGGSPAKLIRPLTEQDVAFFPVSAQNYVELSLEYLTQTEEI